MWLGGCASVATAELMKSEKSAYRLPAVNAVLENDAATGAIAVVLSSSMLTTSGELGATSDNYVSVALASALTGRARPFNWRVFQEGYPGIDAFAAGLNLRDLLGRWPVLTIVETGEGDRYLSEQAIITGLESLVRNQANRRPHPWEKPRDLVTDLVFIHAATPASVQARLQGEEVAAFAAAERVADHYGIPSLDASRVFFESVRSGALSLETIFTPDGGLSAEAHRRLGDALADLIRRALAQKGGGVASLPAALQEQGAIRAPVRVAYERADYGSGWLDWQESPLERFYHVLRADGAPGEVTLDIEGRLLAAEVLLEADTGDLEVSVNEEPWRLVPVFRAELPGGAITSRMVILASGLSPALRNHVRLRVAAATPEGSRGRNMAIAWFFVDGKALNADPSAGLAPLEVADRIYRTMPVIDYIPPPKRWENLVRTRRLLSPGGTLRVVTLGDSIINDMRGSQFEHLLMRVWPGSSIEIFNSVRGSTGCWFYAQEGQVETYITSHRPDLLIIGGISHRNDSEAVRSVIRQTRAILPEVEVLLLTGPFGFVDPIQDPLWRARTEGFSEALRKISAEENAAFFDLQEAWANYIVHRARALNPFKRDVVHANERGRQLLGRLITEYLSPSNAQP